MARVPQGMAAELRCSKAGMLQYTPVIGYATNRWPAVGWRGILLGAARRTVAGPVCVVGAGAVEVIMGAAGNPPPALLLMAVFSRHASALCWARQRAEECWGSIALESPAFEFVETSYYHRQMGSGLRKQFFLFDGGFDPAELAERKLIANAWEAEYARTAAHPEPRPLNIDPGYITLGKLVLASTKDFAHRVYLGRGIYAEVTLFYKHKSWCHHEFTFPDYRRGDYHQFFSQCRHLLKQRIHGRA